MTKAELQALIDGIAPVLKKYIDERMNESIAKSHDELQALVAELTRQLQAKDD